MADNNDSRIWDIASSKILNVPIVDLSTFKQLTGLDWSEFPTTSTGISGKWPMLMGTAEVEKMHKEQSRIHARKGQRWLLGERKLPEDESNADREWEDEDEDEEEADYLDFPVALLDVDDTSLQFSSLAQAFLQRMGSVQYWCSPGLAGGRGEGAIETARSKY